MNQILWKRNSMGYYSKLKTYQLSFDIFQFDFDSMYIEIVDVVVADIQFFFDKIHALKITVILKYSNYPSIDKIISLDVLV